MCLLTQPDLSRAMSGQGKVICTKTADQNQTCLWILGSVQSHRAKDRLLSRWRKCHIPLKWASLGWKPCVSSPDDPRPRLYLCRGESWSWVFCLPARILGSQVGVARQAHHSALGCFAFGVKREAQMRRHCHSGDLWPEQWDTGDRHWRGELSYVSVIFQQILKSFVSALVQNTVWGFNIGSQSHVFEFTLQSCDFSIWQGQHDVHILRASRWKKAQYFSTKWRPATKKIRNQWGGVERSCHRKPVGSFYLYWLAVLTWPHHTDSYCSPERWQNRRESQGRMSVEPVS